MPLPRFPPSAAASGLTSIRNSCATTTVVSAIIDPTDRSMPPATITMVIPTAAMLTIAVWRAISSRFVGAKKRGPTRAPKMMATRMSPSSVPARSTIERVVMRPKLPPSRPS
jgi:hypothetical protein